MKQCDHCIAIFSLSVPAKLLHSHGIAVSRTVGEMVTFNCTADGIPRPQISWRRNGQLLNANQLTRYRVITVASDGFRSDQLPGVQQFESRLTIVNIKEQDRGSFSCLALSEGTVPAVLETNYQLTVVKRTYLFIQFSFLSVKFFYSIAPTPDYCRTSPCENGGTCENLSDGYFCHCTMQFTGLDCHERKL